MAEIRFQVYWVSERAEVPKIMMPGSDTRYLSFIRVHSRQDDVTGVFVPGMFRVAVVPCKNSPPVTIELLPNRAYMIDVGYVVDSSMPVVMVQDIGANTVSQVTLNLPDEVCEQIRAVSGFCE